MAAKKINIGNDHEIQFNQRARGEETPYWQGTIYRNGAEIGNFSNSGRGGSTFVRNNEVETMLSQMVKESAERQDFDFDSFFEPWDLVLESAELFGYKNRSLPQQFKENFQLLLDQIVLETHQANLKFRQSQV